jgi:hypothetical protein
LTYHGRIGCIHDDDYFERQGNMTGKRLLFMFGVLLIMLLGAFALIFAVLNPNATQNSALVPQTPTPTVPVAPQSSDISRVTGTIQSLGQRSFILTLSQGTTTLTIDVNARTTYTSLPANNTASFNILKVGQLVTVSGWPDRKDLSRFTALTILISS